MGISQKGAEFLTRSRIEEATRGDIDALFELGVTYSTGRGGTAVDLVEAHKWFNLAALQGCTRGQQCRDRRVTLIDSAVRKHDDARAGCNGFAGISDNPLHSLFE